MPKRKKWIPTPAAATKVRRLARTQYCEHPVYEPGEPRGYIAWTDWASAMSRFFKQEQCPHCQLYVIWRPKMESIDCTELFVDCQQARAIIDADDNSKVAVCVIRTDDHESPMVSFEMHIDKINNFLDRCRQVQTRMTHLPPAV